MHMCTFDLMTNYKITGVLALGAIHTIDITKMD